MTRRPFARLLAVVLLALVAGCGSDAGFSSSPGASGSGGHVFPELEARIPHEVGGQTLDSASIRTDPTLQDSKTLRVLARLHRTPEDLQLASASLDGLDIMVGALRILGAAADDSIAAFRAEDEADAGSQAVYGTATMGDKQVTTRTLGEEVTYIYATEDILYFVTGRDDLVIEVLGKL